MTLKGWVFRRGLHVLAALGVHWPLTFLLVRSLQEVRADGTVTSVQRQRDDDRITVLALTAERFRGDLETLVRTGKFRVLLGDFAWQTRFMTAFYPGEMDFFDYYNPQPGSSLQECQTRLRQFLGSLLAQLYRHMKIDAVIGAATHYQFDYDWGVASTQIGIPYIVFHRECYLASPNLYRQFRDRWTKMGRFKGSHIVVYDENTRTCLIDSGFASPDEVLTLGCLRMDDFVRSVIPFRPTTPKPRKKVTLFSFNHGAGTTHLKWATKTDPGFERLFEEVHVAFATLAKRRTDVDFVIKPKWGGNWLENIDSVLARHDIDASSVGNLEILPDVNVHDLIEESDVLCGGINSNTMLEAGVAGKAFVIPYFAEATGSYNGFVKITESFHLFDVAASAAEFVDMIEMRLESPEIDEDCLQGRYELFNRWVSDVEGKATEKYVAALSQIVGQSRKPASEDALKGRAFGGNRITRDANLQLLETSADRPTLKATEQ